MKKLISSILVFAVIAASILIIPLTSANATETTGGEYEIRYDASDRVIVSLGDSYSAILLFSAFFRQNRYRR